MAPEQSAAELSCLVFPTKCREAGVCLTENVFDNLLSAVGHGFLVNEATTYIQ